jgi:DNA-binding NarL/FixJ family response regulator
MNNNFTPKDIKILKCLSKGKGSKEIAKTLKYTPGTIENYIKNLMLKTNTNNRIQLMYEVVKNGIID